MTDATLVPEEAHRRDTLWVTDAELIRRMGVPEKIARTAIKELDAKRMGFPQKSPLWGGRRYWPAVVAFLDRSQGLNVMASKPGSISHVRKVTAA